MAPFRDAFTSVFFMSIGMLLHINVEWLHVNLLSAIVVIIVNAFIVSVLLQVIGVKKRVAIMSGVILAEIGEFSFLIATTGLTNGILSDAIYQNILVCIIATLVITPALVNLAPKIADFFDKPVQAETQV